MRKGRRALMTPEGDGGWKVASYGRKNPGSRADARLALALFILSIACACSPESGMSGEQLFQQYCAGCHPNGGNTVIPAKSLDGRALAAANISTVGDIVDRIRNPGQGMPAYSRNIITDRDAEKIAEFILERFAE